MVLLSLLLVGCQEYKIGTQQPVDTDLPTLVEPPPPPTEDPVNYDAPIVDCSASTYIVAPPYEQVQLFADATDPNGLPISGWQWSVLSGPGGSDAQPTPATSKDSALTPDLAGVYELGVVATNSAGEASEPCTFQIESISSEDLRVEMFWDQQGDDMDLHLLAPGGTLRSPTDCYYRNCQPSSAGLDWGAPGFADDDPTLDLDDVTGDGPENINIVQPENGIYTVVVHDFGTDANIGTTEITVNIYLDGALTWTDTRQVTGDDIDHFFAEINWTNRQVIGL